MLGEAGLQIRDGPKDDNLDKKSPERNSKSRSFVLGNQGRMILHPLCPSDAFGTSPPKGENNKVLRSLHKLLVKKRIKTFG